MNDMASDPGGGKYNTYNLDIAQIDQASRTDFEKVSEMETRRDGWTAYRDLMADMKADLAAEMPNLVDNFDSPAGRVFAESLQMMSDSIANHREVADSNRESSDSVITEVKRVRPLIEEIMEDRKLAVDNRNELQSMEQDGSDAYSNALEDTLAEARRTFSESNGVYSTSSVTMEPPPEYTGPVYDGPGPKTGLDDGYKHAYYPDDTPYRGGGNSGGSQGINSSNPSGSSGSPTGNSDIPGRSDEAELQGPGGTQTSPNVPPTGTGPGTGPVTGGGGGNVPTYLPGGTGPTGTGPGAKPVTPLGSRPTTTPVNQARPTPGMNRPLGGGTGTRPTAPISGRGTSGGAPKNSLLPNQRQAQAGRTPVTGSGRVPNGANGRGPGGSGPRGVTAARAGGAPGGGRGGLVRGKPNAGFEENLYRNTRAGRTVPGVINGARGAEAGARPGGAASRPSASGKVFGQRKNKGQKEKPQRQRLQSGALTDPAKRKKDTRHTWQRMPVEQSTQPLTGSVALVRNGAKKPLTPDEIAQEKLRARKQWRRKFYKSQQEPKLEPASDLFGGTEGKVTRSVIRGAGVSHPVERRDAGTRFSTYGWEDND